MKNYLHTFSGISLLYAVGQFCINKTQCVYIIYIIITDISEIYFLLTKNFYTHFLKSLQQILEVEIIIKILTINEEKVQRIKSSHILSAFKTDVVQDVAATTKRSFHTESSLAACSSPDPENLAEERLCCTWLRSGSSTGATTARCSLLCWPGNQAAVQPSMVRPQLLKLSLVVSLMLLF